MAKKKAKSKKAKKVVQPEVRTVEVVKQIVIGLNEAELVEILKGRNLNLGPSSDPSLIQVRHQAHPAVTPPGMAKFWADVELLAREKRHNMGGFRNLNRDMDNALDQKEFDHEDRTGVAVRQSELAAHAVAARSWELPIHKQICAQVQKQQEQMDEIVRNSASPEDAEQKLKSLTVTNQPLLGEHHGEEVK